MHFASLSTMVRNLVVSDHPNFSTARKNFNRRFDIRPLAIAFCTSESEVTECIQWALSEQIAVSIRSGGHSPCGHSLIENGLVIDVSGLKQFDFDPANNTCRVGPGITWGELNLHLARYRVVVPGGNCTSVGISGGILGGGYSHLSRTEGLSCDALLDARLVDCEGRAIDVSDARDPDLMWALRGAGGGHFGVVTELRLKTTPLLDKIYGGSMTWPMSMASEVASLYFETFLESMSESISLDLVFVTQGSSRYIRLDGLSNCQGENAEKLIAKFRNLPNQVKDEFSHQAHSKVIDYLSADTIAMGTTFSAKWRGGYFDGLSHRSFISEIIALHNQNASYLMTKIELTSSARVLVPPNPSAFPHRARKFYVLFVSNWLARIASKREIDWPDLAKQSTSPNFLEGVYGNYPEDSLKSWGQDYYGENFQQLKSIKARVDPRGFFSFEQSIPCQITP